MPKEQKFSTFKIKKMSNYTSIDFDATLDAATNIKSINWNGEEWTVSYKNDLPPDHFGTSQEMIEFLVNEGND